MLLTCHPIAPRRTSPYLSVKEKAVAALQNLSVDASNRTAISDCGGLPAIVYLLTYGSPLAKERAAGALSNLAVNTANKRRIAELGAIPPLILLLGGSSAGSGAANSGSTVTVTAQQNAATALSNMAVEEQNRQWIADLGGIPPLIALLSGGTPVAQVRSI